MRYVGWTIDLRHRVMTHMAVAGRGHKRHVCAWLRKLIQDNVRPAVWLLETCDREDWASREVYWINKMRVDGHSLTNGTDGGEGLLGHKLTPEQIEKMAAAKRGKPSPNKGIKTGKPAWNRGVSPSDESRARMSKAHTGLPQSPASKEKNRLASTGKQYALGYKHTPEGRERMSIAHLGQKRTPEQRERIRQAALKREANKRAATP
jgi:hypothetical protein